MQGVNVLFCGKLSLTGSTVTHRTKYITFLELHREYQDADGLVAGGICCSSSR